MFLLPTLLAVCFVLPCLSMPPIDRQLTFDTCRTDSDCISPRTCVENFTGEMPCTASDPECICLALEDNKTCETSNECVCGELCLDQQGFNRCTSAEKFIVQEPLLPFLRIDKAFTGDLCVMATDCAGRRTCWSNGARVPQCTPGERCTCQTKRDVKCTTDDDCVPQEGCMDGKCISKNVIRCSKDDETVQKPEISTEPTPVISPIIGPIATETPDMGISPSPVSAIGVDGPTSQPSPSAQAEPLMSPDIDDESFMPSGEPDPEESLSPAGEGIDTIESPSAEDGTNDTVSSSGEPDVPSTQAPTTTTTTTAVCVDADRLKGLDKDDLVFESHQWANVLCDGYGSCATKGHMVLWEGKAMMMGSYCEVVGCEQKEMWVNSPRWKRARRVESGTKGLEFTAFAARWETRVEEHALRTAVRLGM